jgi:hypothetical protein
MNTLKVKSLGKAHAFRTTRTKHCVLEFLLLTSHRHQGGTASHLGMGPGGTSLIGNFNNKNKSFSGEIRS